MKIVKPNIEVTFHYPVKDGEIMSLEKFFELCGRTCYKSEDKITPDSSKKFIKMLMNRGHESVLEHCVASARWICNRGVTHELVRHRIGSYSQESTRYCDYSKDKHDKQIKLIPMQDNLTEEQWLRRLNLYNHIEQVYLAEISEGIKPQQARDNLPICLKTEIVSTFNLREWKHVFSLRCSKYAHPQIRDLSLQALEVFAEEIPSMFGKMWEEMKENGHSLRSIS